LDVAPQDDGDRNVRSRTDPEQQAFNTAMLKNMQQLTAQVNRALQALNLPTARPTPDPRGTSQPPTGSTLIAPPPLLTSEEMKGPRSFLAVPAACRRFTGRTEVRSAQR
jgi:hypothetical protein